jgi:uncharacterized protein (TIGR02145 family)
MIRPYTLIASLILLTTGLRSQSITITFDATLNGASIPLDSILVMNLTAGGDTTIYFPDNELVLITVGIREAGSPDLAMRSLPNPFAGSTEVMLEAAGGVAVIALYDIAGREIVSQAANLTAGVHRFRVNCERAGVHLLSVTQGGVRRTIRLMATEGKGTASVMHLGGSERGMPKSDRSLFTWSAGNELRYTGYVTGAGVVNSAAIDEVPVASATRTFVLTTVDNCSGASTVTDIDGNIYPVVSIGNQCWMAANLKTTRYTDGSTIPNVTDDFAWSQLTSGAWSNYNNSAANDAIYGKLYNWYGAMSGNICPEGWHLPTDTEWKELELALGMPSGEVNNDGLRGAGQNVGGKMKATTLWNAPNTGATNESGFSGLPGGYRVYLSGSFNELGGYGGWWSASETGTIGGAWFRYLDNAVVGVSRYYTNLSNGLCLRCVRD